MRSLARAATINHWGTTRAQVPSEQRALCLLRLVHALVGRGHGQSPIFHPVPPPVAVRRYLAVGLRFLPVPLQLYADSNEKRLWPRVV